ncbi:MAG: signal peptidase I [Sandaracinus sp.]|nr:signal peptidase I [Myxococcales bacterium]MCB9611304.1 signal peptidase I [Sandaracinus sp.]MCB9633288.1 signal peptidase I [Sandaracinus sp.]
MWKAVGKGALWFGALLLVVVGVLRLFFLDVVEVGHDGMAPTMIAGESVLMWRGVDEPDMGDVLVCHHPTATGQMVLGRVVGKPGMTLRDVRGALEIAGSVPDRDVLEEERFFDQTTNREDSYRRSLVKLGNTDHYIFERHGFTFRLRETRVDPNRVYLMGDNRAASQLDSRAFGAVPVSNCLGTLFMRFRPATTRSAELDHGWFGFLDP